MRRKLVIDVKSAVEQQAYLRLMQYAKNHDLILSDDGKSATAGDIDFSKDDTPVFAKITYHARSWYLVIKYYIKGERREKIKVKKDARRMLGSDCKKRKRQTDTSENDI